MAYFDDSFKPLLDKFKDIFNYKDLSSFASLFEIKCTPLTLLITVIYLIKLSQFVIFNIDIKQFNILRSNNVVDFRIIGFIPVKAY